MLTDTLVNLIISNSIYNLNFCLFTIIILRLIFKFPHWKVWFRLVSEKDPKFENKIKIVAGSGCYSYVGFQGVQHQSISLREVGCLSRGTVQLRATSSLNFRSYSPCSEVLTPKVLTNNPRFKCVDNLSHFSAHFSAF